MRFVRITFIVSLFLVVSIANIQSQCIKSGSFGNYTTFTTTGNNILDDILNNEMALLESVFGTRLDLLIYDDSQSPNCGFSAICELSNCHGTMLMGRNMMADEINRTNGAESIKLIMAHEVAHSLQKYWGFPKSSFNHYQELHADFLAGYYMGLKHYFIEQQDVKLFTETMFHMRDENFNFYNPNAHGTSTMRKCAFLEGFICVTERNYSIYQAYYAGIDYVGLNDPCTSWKPKRTYQQNFVPYRYPIQLVIGVIAVTAPFLFANEVSTFFSYSFDYSGLSPLSTYKSFRSGPGIAFLLRKNFNFSGNSKAAIEYGFSYHSLTGIYQISGVNYNYVTPQVTFHFDYMHRVFTKNKLYLSAGPSIALSDYGFAVGGIFSAAAKIHPRIKLDSRIEITSAYVQFRIGIQFLYQKRYFWEKMEGKYVDYEQ